MTNTEPASAPEPQQPYAQAPYGQAYVQAQFALMPPQPTGLSVTSLVLGLVSILVGFTVLLPIGAVVFGIIGARKESTARGMSVTGIVLGALCLLGWVVLGGLAFAFLATVIGGSAVFGASY